MSNEHIFSYLLQTDLKTVTTKHNYKSPYIIHGPPVYNQHTRKQLKQEHVSAHRQLNTNDLTIIAKI